MKTAHVYLFADHTKSHWRVRVFFPGGGMKEAAGIHRNPRSARLWAVLNSNQYPVKFMSTKSVPDPESL